MTTREPRGDMICWACAEAGAEPRHDDTVQIVAVKSEDGTDLGKHPLCENCREEMAIYE